MKYRDVLQAHPNWQAYSRNLKVYVQIRLSERGKVSGIPYWGYLQAKKGEKQVVKSHLCDKQLAKQRNALIAQAKNIVSPRKGWTEKREIHLYNSMVMGMKNYYCNATHITIDCSSLNRSVMTVFQNRLNRGKSVRLRKEGRPLTQTEKDRYGKSSMLRYVVGSDEPIYPVGC